MQRVPPLRTSRESGSHPVTAGPPPAYSEPYESTQNVALRTNRAADSYNENLPLPSPHELSSIAQHLRHFQVLPQSLSILKDQVPGAALEGATGAGAWHLEGGARRGSPLRVAARVEILAPSCPGTCPAPGDAAPVAHPHPPGVREHW